LARLVGGGQGGNGYQKIGDAVLSAKQKFRLGSHARPHRRRRLEKRRFDREGIGGPGTGADFRNHGAAITRTDGRQYDGCRQAQVNLVDNGLWDAEGNLQGALGEYFEQRLAAINLYKGVYRPRCDDGVERCAQGSLAQVTADPAEFRLRDFDVVLCGFESRLRLVERRLADSFFRE